MSACPIQVLSAATTSTDTTASPVTDSDREGLLGLLSAVPDPRSRHGLRYPLSGLLTVAVCAVMAGASSIAAIADWLHDLDDVAYPFRPVVDRGVGFGVGSPESVWAWMGG